MADIGIRFSMGGKTGSTVDSQRLLAWCLEKYGWQKQNELVEALFLDNFQNERFIGDPTVLLDASKRVGIDDAAEVLGEGNEAVFLDEVMTQYQSYTERFGMDGVPSWIIDGSIVHMGAQSVQEFINVFLDLE
mmetsp:Transcript_4607/g.18351  ORF Transcript_4607/g.18351 Transcript_4607/m.18351 type:complete len:133 (-) Transcript_4607:2321-2719(-)